MIPDKLSVAFKERWWVERRHRPPVQGALIIAHTCYWRPRIQRQLDANKACHREPSSWAGLAAALRMDDANLYRHRVGEINSTAQDLLAIATLLRVSMDKLVPPIETWITEATLLLCEGPLSREEARAYTLYRLSEARAHNPHLDQAVIAEIHQKMQPHFPDNRDAEQAILKAGAQLADRLTRKGGRP